MRRYAWHFVAADGRLGYGDGREVRVGETYKVDCTPILCEQGLHYSRRIIDALKYAPGPLLCKVIPGGTVIKGYDKGVGTERTVIAMADATDALRAFARAVAYEVWIKHFPDTKSVVARWLLTGNESLRAEAESAAESAEWSAESAAWAAESAAWAAWSAVGAAAWSAVGAAWAAAAWAAEESAKAAKSAAWAAHNKRLLSMVRKLEWKS